MPSDFDLTAIANSATAAASSLAGSAIQRVHLDTTLLPPMDLVGGTSDEGSSLGLGPLLKPKLTVDLGVGSPIVYAPYGDPGDASWLPFLLVEGLLLYAAYKLGRTRRGA